MRDKLIRWTLKERSFYMVVFSVMLLFGYSLLISAQTTAPRGDYGDAPDGFDAYGGVPGRFPTLYESTSGRMGGHTLTVGEEMIGTEVSAEMDADDPSDPDGVQNLVDQDKDDPVYTLIVVDGIPASASFTFEVTVDQSAPAGKRYINALVDFDQNGSWGGKEYGKEWAVKNFPVEIPPGTTRRVTTPRFYWGSGMIMPTPVWVRLSITREPINIDDWDGSGEFQYGEIQDFEVRLTDWDGPEDKPKPKPKPGRKPKCGNDKREAGEQCDGTDDKACPGKCKADCTCPKPGGGPGKPGPDEGPCTTPVEYYALVINGGDHPGQSAAHEVGEGMTDLFLDQGYWVRSLGQKGEADKDGSATLAEIEASIEDLKSKIKCVDRVMIFIIGHGLEKDDYYGRGSKRTKYPTGGVILQGSKEILTPEKLNDMLSEIPACPNEDCRKPEVTCHMSIVIESCHAGNFFNTLKGIGRTVAISSTAEQVSYFGSDGSGGEYSDGFISDMNDPDNSDTNKDGYVSVGEAHESSKAKMDPSIAKRQSPMFDSQECECLPITCGPPPEDNVTENITDDDEGPDDSVVYCGDGTRQPGEQCDTAADPTGCVQGKICTEDCRCLTPEDYCDEQNEYEDDDCEERCTTYQACMINELTSCYSCVTYCNRHEYLDSGCLDECSEGEECVMTNEAVPCYECEETEVPLTCEDRDMYTEQSDCESDCQSPDYCAFHEGYDCWYCQDVDITCSGDLYENPDCDGQCDDGELCQPYGDYCYRCEDIPCPDLYVNALSLSVRRYASTTCQGEYCETFCELRTDDETTKVDFKIKNSGSASAGASTAHVELSPNVGSEDVSIGSLSSGQETGTHTVTFYKSATVSGSGMEACAELNWWAGTYTATVTADYGGAVDECDEGNNVQSVQSSGSS